MNLEPEKRTPIPPEQPAPNQDGPQVAPPPDEADETAQTEAQPGAQAAKKGKPGKKIKKEKPKKTVGQEILSWVWTFLAAILIATVIRATLFEPIRVDGESMRETLQDGDIVLVTKPAYLAGKFSRGDLIICRYPNRSTGGSLSLGGKLEVSYTSHTLFVKRLIALPGDTLEIVEGVVYVNDEKVDESGINTFIPSESSYPRRTLGEDEYFVMGDNRGNSNDSRRVGPISRNMIVGHVKCVLWPLSDFGKVE